MIGYHYLIKNKDMAHLNCNKYRIENEDDHDRFEETFMGERKCAWKRSWI